MGVGGRGAVLFKDLLFPWEQCWRNMGVRDGGRAGLGGSGLRGHLSVLEVACRGRAPAPVH